MNKRNYISNRNIKVSQIVILLLAVIPLFLLLLYFFFNSLNVLIIAAISFTAISAVNLLYYKIYDVYIEDGAIVFENLFKKGRVDIDLFEKAISIYPPFFLLKFKNNRKLGFIYTYALPFGSLFRKESYTETFRKKIEKHSLSSDTA